MGMLRALLALSVIFAHTGNFNLIGGRNAVQIFYLISGFLISYVVTERRNFSSKINFYVSRYLRLFPQYIVIALSTLAAYILIPSLGIEFFRSINSLAPIGAATVLLSNILLYGQDWLMFTHIDGGNLRFSSNFRDNPMPSYHALLLPQSWTLGIELSFYVIAPFILQKRYLIFILLILSFLVRAYVFQQGLGMVDPWSYRFFPAELLLFLAGALTHQYGLPLYRKIASNRLNLISTFFAIGAICLYPLFQAPEIVKTILLFGIILTALPAMFMFQHGRDWDGRLGELSYPMYINHILVILLVTWTGLIANKVAFTISVVLLSIGLSLIMIRWIGNPVDRWRRKFNTEVSKPETVPVGGKAITRVP